MILDSFFVSAQVNSDSLLRIVQQGRADTAHVVALLGLANFELELPEPTRNLDKALQYEQQAIALARKIGFVQGQGRALLWENDYFELLGRSAEQTKRLEAAVDLFMSIKAYYWTFLKKGGESRYCVCNNIIIDASATLTQI